jgi:hypothetical protein
MPNPSSRFPSSLPEFTEASIGPFDVFPDYEWAATLEIPPDFEQLISQIGSGDFVLGPDTPEPTPFGV